MERIGRYLNEPPVDGLYVTLRAEQLRRAGKYDQAISLLEGLMNGSEPFHKQEWRLWKLRRCRAH